MVKLLSLWGFLAGGFPQPEVKHYPGQGLHDSFETFFFFFTRDVLWILYCKIPTISIDFS